MKQKKAIMLLSLFNIFSIDLIIANDNCGFVLKNKSPFVISVLSVFTFSMIALIYYVLRNKIWTPEKNNFSESVVMFIPIATMFAFSCNNLINKNATSFIDYFITTLITLLVVFAFVNTCSSFARLKSAKTF